LAGGFGDDLFLLGFGFGNTRIAHGLRPANQRVAFGFSCRDIGVSLDQRHIRAAHVQDVFVVVTHFLDGEGDDFQSHLAHVIGNVGAHPVGHHLGFLDDVLDRQLADDAAQVAFHHQTDERLALFGRFVQKLLGCGQDTDRVGLDLDLGNRFHIDGHPLRRIEVLGGRDIETHQLQREFARLLDQRPDDASPALDDFGAAKSIDDERLVRPDFVEELGRHEEEQKDHRDQADNDDRDSYDRHSFDLPDSAGRSAYVRLLPSRFRLPGQGVLPSRRQFQRELAVTVELIPRATMPIPRSAPQHDDLGAAGNGRAGRSAGSADHARAALFVDDLSHSSGANRRGDPREFSRKLEITRIELGIPSRADDPREDLIDDVCTGEPSAEGHHNADRRCPTRAIPCQIANTTEPGNERENDADIQIVVDAGIAIVTDVAATMIGAQIQPPKRQRDDRKEESKKKGTEKNGVECVEISRHRLSCDQVVWAASRRGSRNWSIGRR